MIAGFNVVRELGKGMVGRVFEAVTDAGRRVVVKAMREHVARSPELKMRFVREAEAMQRISHPNVMPVLSVNAETMPPYFVMPYKDGDTFAHALSHSAMPLPRILRIIRDIAYGLAEIHHAGLVHRDVKPANVFLTNAGDAMLLDFGLAKELETLTEVTKDGELLGTPAYMAPEQIRGERVSGKTDVYALGVTTMEAIIGRNPFGAKDMIEVFRRHLECAPRRLDALQPHRVSRELADLVERALSKDPAQRPMAVEFAVGIGKHLERLSADRAARTEASQSPPTTTRARPKPVSAAS